jgi:sterol desaturase/sphingolipid hydroxylase (fatty acid hydroxylase superfamily)
MNSSFALPVAVAAACLMILFERLFPATKLPVVAGWWFRAILANLVQIAIVVVAGFTWNLWLRGPSLLHASRWPDAAAAGATYFISTFVFYWWHRVRHESPFWWRFAHQIHHSASRLEIFTAFYKHPLEISLDSVLSAVLVYPLMGCSPFQGALYTVLIAVGEMFYHWNIHTPRWVGTFFQRPESHRIHHQRDRHTKNYADLPLWDFIFGTYANPKHADTVRCGFGHERETLLLPMLMGKPVETTREPEPLNFRPACFGCRKQRLCRHNAWEK